MRGVPSYLRASGFKIFIVAGGGQGFLRISAEQTYGIPPDPVVETAGGIACRYDKADGPMLTKEPRLPLNDDKAGKPQGIHLMIGRRCLARDDRAA